MVEISDLERSDEFFDKITFKYVKSSNIRFAGN
jgi:hypothetical protein